MIVRKLVSNITGHSEETISKNQEIARLAVTKSFLLAGRTLLYITLHYITYLPSQHKTDTFQHQPHLKTTWTRVITAMTVMEMWICPHWLYQSISRETVSYCETQCLSSYRDRVEIKTKIICCSVYLYEMFPKPVLNRILYHSAVIIIIILCSGEVIPKG